MKTSAAFRVVSGLFGAAAAVPAPASSETAAVTATATTAGPAPSCTAALITTLCDYPTPDIEFAAASTGKESCWQFCQEHGPCNFAIFVAGNPHTGAGTCWAYPGETFDARKGSSSSSCAFASLSVFGKPTCIGTKPGPADGVPAQCSAAVASPSPIAKVCDYPTPPNDCRDSCTASNSASFCLAQCAQADSCSYAVFVPRGGSKSPYSPGSCWMYPEGTYDEHAGKMCSGAPEQYVYNNTCPRPSPTKSVLPSSSATGAAQSGDSKLDSAKPDDATAGIIDSAVATPSGNAAPTGLALSRGLAAGVAALAWNAL
ncbi:hypothetical protein V2A60_004012 [Cordyceps javanica]